MYLYFPEYKFTSSILYCKYGRNTNYNTKLIKAYTIFTITILKILKDTGRVYLNTARL